MSDRTGYRFATGRNRGFRKPNGGALSAAAQEDIICSDKCKSSSAERPVRVVSRAISQVAPLSNSREKLTTETSDTKHKSCNKSRGDSKNTAKPNCYKCKYRGEIPGNAHSKCVHPSISEITNCAEAEIIGLLGSRGIARLGLNLGAIINNAPNNPLGVRGSDHGVKSGWFNWPVNFDPVWLVSCNGFEPDERNQALGESDEQKGN